jgi:hypothetical protein
VPYLNCSRCGLSIRVRFASIEPENCPRCLARSHVVQPLFRSRLTIGELSAHGGEPSPPGATRAA